MILEWRMGMRWRRERASRVLVTSEASPPNDAGIQHKPQKSVEHDETVISEGILLAEVKYEKKRADTV